MPKRPKHPFRLNAHKPAYLNYTQFLFDHFYLYAILMVSMLAVLCFVYVCLYVVYVSSSSPSRRYFFFFLFFGCLFVLLSTSSGGHSVHSSAPCYPCLYICRRSYTTEKWVNKKNTKCLFFFTQTYGYINIPL